MSAPSSGNEGFERPFRPQSPLVIGLVGGVAAGKSRVAGLFENRGILHVDADFHARAASDDPEVVRAVAQQLGAAFVRDGQLDREALARSVFGDPKSKAKLEEILHPRVRQRIVTELDRAHKSGQSVVLDVPLLFEAGLFSSCDTIVFVDASHSIRQERARARGWAANELERREANQLPLDTKRARSQHVIENSGDLRATKHAVDALLAELETNA